MLSVGNGLPVAAAVLGANVHDTQLLEITLDSIVIERPDYILPAMANNAVVCHAAYGGFASQRLARAV